MEDRRWMEVLGHGDLELAEYRVRALEQRARQGFRMGELIPHLPLVGELHRTVCALLNTVQGLAPTRPGAITGIDWLRGTVQREAVAPEEDTSGWADFLRWAEGLLTPLVEEGRTLLAFVESKIRLQPVGILPMITREGFLAVEVGAEAWRAWRFSSFVQTGLQAAALNVQEEPSVEAPHPQGVREVLRKRYADRSALACFSIHTDVPFPVEATLLPAARRPLERFLFG